MMWGADPQYFWDPWTDSRSIAHKKLRMWTNVDPTPSTSLMRMLFFEVTAERHSKAAINLDAVVARYHKAIS